jgi:aldose 1-epimerase
VLDHNFVLRKNNKLQKAASLRLRDTQLQLDVLTTQPALQVYTGDGLTAPFSARAGICLEAQAFPDAPNQSNFPSIVLTPGRTYRQRTIYRFGELSDH